MNLKLVCPVCLCDEFSISNNTFLCENCQNTYDTKDLILYGNFYIYRFINDDWGGIPFYVGKGCGDRYRQIDTRRSKHIQSICKKWNWHTEILKYYDTELQALAGEKELKEAYRRAGYPIIDGELEAHEYAQRRGIEQAKLRGMKFGRPPVLKPNNWDSVYDDWKAGKITAKEAMRRLDLKRTTFYKFAKESSCSG